MLNHQNDQRFVLNKLPWLVALGAFILYALTLNHWVTLRSVAVAAKVTGWDWNLPVEWPLFYTVTFPLRVLPSSLQLIGLNAFAAICSALTLGILVRSVGLLPHDRTHEQRLREQSDHSLLSIPTRWLPPLLAALVCGLELTFWEHSIALTHESFDLLLLAIVIWTLLEYRITQNKKWIFIFAFVYGIGVPDNLALIGFAPAFAIALIWMFGKNIFQPKLLLPMIGLALVGLLFYFLLPTVWVIKHGESFKFFDVLRANLGAQKALLLDTPSLRSRVLILSLTSVLPLLVMGIRWPQSFGETSVTGAQLTNIIFRVVHFLFFAACLFVALDRKFSPRALGMGMPLLSLYYLGALCIGYYAGYLLLVATHGNLKNWQRESGFISWTNNLLAGLVYTTAVAFPSYLLYQNWPVIRSDDGSSLKQFTAATVSKISNEPSILLSEDPTPLLLLHAWFSEVQQPSAHALVNVRALQNPSYHDELTKHYPKLWPKLETTAAEMSQASVTRILTSLSATHPIFYLHPSFGLFFETMRPEPHGQIYRMISYKKDDLLLPVVSGSMLEENTIFWKTNAPFLNSLTTLGREQSAASTFLGKFYSLTLNNWGTTLHRAGHLEPAKEAFSLSLELNPRNLAANANLDFNQTLRTGVPRSAQKSTKLEDEFNKSTWIEILTSSGTFDDSTFGLRQAQLFLEQGLHRQAASLFDRAVQTQPTNVVARLSLANAYVYARRPEEALKLIRQVQKLPTQALSPTNQVDLISIEAGAYFNSGEAAKAETVLKAGMTKFPQDRILFESLTELYRTTGETKKALDLLERDLASHPQNILVMLQKVDILITLSQFPQALVELDRIQKIIPDHIQALLYRAFISLQTKDYKQAQTNAERVLAADADNPQALIYLGILGQETKNYTFGAQALTKVLKKTPNNFVAMRNRAILYLEAGKLNEAKQDYNVLLRNFPDLYSVYYGLGEIAWQQKDTVEAIQNYTLYLKYVPKDNQPDLVQEKKIISQRLAELKAVSR